MAAYLVDGPGEAVQDESGPTLRSFDGLLDDAYNEIVGHQCTGIHGGFGLKDQRQDGKHQRFGCPMQGIKQPGDAMS
eukprot:scaffold131490_cov41-Prasinocladus_malaysianus.AAC.1